MPPYLWSFVSDPRPEVWPWHMKAHGTWHQVCKVRAGVHVLLWYMLVTLLHTAVSIVTLLHTLCRGLGRGCRREHILHSVEENTFYYYTHCAEDLVECVPRPSCSSAPRPRIHPALPAGNADRPLGGWGCSECTDFVFLRFHLLRGC